MSNLNIQERVRKTHQQTVRKDSEVEKEVLTDEELKKRDYETNIKPVLKENETELINRYISQLGPLGYQEYMVFEFVKKYDFNPGFLDSKVQVMVQQANEDGGNWTVATRSKSKAAREKESKSRDYKQKRDNYKDSDRNENQEGRNNKQFYRRNDDDGQYQGNKYQNRNNRNFDQNRDDNGRNDRNYNKYPKYQKRNEDEGAETQENGERGTNNYNNNGDYNRDTRKGNYNKQNKYQKTGFVEKEIYVKKKPQEDAVIVDTKTGDQIIYAKKENKETAPTQPVEHVEPTHQQVKEEKPVTASPGKVKAEYNASNITQFFQDKAHTEIREKEIPAKPEVSTHKAETHAHTQAHHAAKADNHKHETPKQEVHSHKQDIHSHKQDTHSHKQETHSHKQENHSHKADHSHKNDQHHTKEVVNAPIEHDKGSTSATKPIIDNSNITHQHSGSKIVQENQSLQEQNLHQQVLLQQQQLQQLQQQILFQQQQQQQFLFNPVNQLTKEQVQTLFPKDMSIPTSPFIVYPMANGTYMIQPYVAPSPIIQPFYNPQPFFGGFQPEVQLTEDKTKKVRFPDSSSNQYFSFNDKNSQQGFSQGNLNFTGNW